MSHRRGGRICAALCIAFGTWLSLAGAPALATPVSHDLEGGFNGNDAPDGPLQFVFGLDADNSGGPGDGNVYVAELSNIFTVGARVLRFDEDGNYDGVEIDGSTTPQGSFSFVNPSFVPGFDGVAVDGSAGANGGDLYIGDLDHGVVLRFDEDGNYVCQITGSTTPSASECNGIGGSATPDGSFVPTGAAVDPGTGTLYVSDFEHGVIDMFNEAGAYVGQIADPNMAQPGAIDLDSTGALYVANGPPFAPENLLKFDSAGNFVSVFDSEGRTTVAVDTSTDEVFAAALEGGEIVKFDSAGNSVATIAAEESLLSSLAVVAATGRLFAGNIGVFEEGSTVDIYSPDTIVPDVSAGPAAGVEETVASLSGEVDPAGGGDVVSCRFEYGLLGSFHDSAPCSPAPPYSAPTAVSADLSGLDPSTVHNFRLAAANAGLAPYTRGVHARSAPGNFSTVGPPTIEEESTTDVDRYAAVLRAEINPRGFDTEYRFEFVDDEHFESEEGFASAATRSTPLSELGGGSSALSVGQGIAGLTVGTTYHYRAVATNERGTGVGPSDTFTTTPVATIGRQWAYVSVRSASLEAKINPFGIPTSCHVQYVEESEFGESGFASAQTEPCLVDAGDGSGDATVRADVDGLALDTTYRFRFVATNSSGTLVAESEESFTTFGVADFSFELVDEDGNPYTQAGGHPYAKILRYRFHTTTVPTKSGSAPSLEGFIKDVITEQPPGQSSGKAESVPLCPGHVADEQKCDKATRVGTANIEAINNGSIASTSRAIYNVEPPDGVASRYAAVDPYTALDSKVRTASDYGLTSTGHNIGEEARVVVLKTTLWGVPADHNGSESPRTPNLRAPTACEGPQTARVRVNTWEAPDEFATATDELPGITGCDKLEFHPSFEWEPSTQVADSPTGLRVDIHQEQKIDPDELAYADLRHVAIDPAKGLAFNPAGASGLAGCSSAQIEMERETPARCPEASKVGKVEIVTPLLEESLRGGIYMATPHDNPFDSMFAIYLAVDEPKRGVTVKLAGEIQADPGDGRLGAVFADNPQLPVEDFKLEFFGGPLSILRTPLECGEYPVDSTLTPWSAPQSGPPAHPSDSYAITAAPNGGPCVAHEAEAPNAPAFRAGTVRPLAGAYAPFVVVLHREDGTQEIADVQVAPPPGLLGKLAGIPRCPDAALVAAEGKSGEEERNAPSCSAASQVGTVVVGAGAGPQPFHVTGNVYVAGPYRGAPMSVGVVVPIVAGPFDLGTVVVRTPLNVDLETGQVQVHSDPIPSIVEGVPLDVRTIAVKLDRPGFTVNPTRCKPTATYGTVTSVPGQTLSLREPFQVGRCGRLGFAPRARLRLLGRKTNRRAHPPLRAVLTMPKRGANIAGVAVSMPSTEFLDTEHIRGICTRSQFAAGACPPGSIYGYARAWSPLLDKPLVGPVYLRSATRGLPDLVADLNGEFHLALAGRIGSGRPGIRANVKNLPDVPMRRFVLTMRGGRRGLLQNSVDVCDRQRRARIDLTAQNGKVRTLHPILRANCRRGSRAAAHDSHRRERRARRDGSRRG